MSEELLLEGIKVLEVSSWIAAPSCGAMLADRGAEVIKVEPPEVGDAYRGYYMLPPSPNSEVNFTWILDNRNKRSMTLNLKSEQGKAILHRLVQDCDIYITNQPLPFRREQGLTWEDLQPLNERMIYASITAYGEQGPERDREGYRAEKKRVAGEVIEALEGRLGDFQEHVEVVDVATPATFIRYTNNWQGSYEGWLPRPGSLMNSIKKELPGLKDFYLIGQWVEPGGGLPPAIMSGRNVTQLICRRDGKDFRVLP